VPGGGKMQSEQDSTVNELILYRYYRSINWKDNEQIESLKRLFINSELKFSYPEKFDGPFDCRSFRFTLSGVKRSEAITWIRIIG
jgi:hypothetical protein